MDHLKTGRGNVPAIPLLKDCVIALGGLPTEEMLSYSEKNVPVKGLDFSASGVTTEALKAFFAGAVKESVKREPIVESGNKYGVSNDFHKLNAALIFHDMGLSPWYLTLCEADQVRAKEFLEIILFNSEVRNRNPLHPSVLDACVIGNLLNFPKHLFGFPFGGYATDGNESLSLVLYAYRLRRKALKAPRIVFVKDDVDLPGAVEARNNVKLVAQRLGMELVEVSVGKLRGSLGGEQQQGEGVVLVMASLEGASLTPAVEWAQQTGLAVHVHVTDSQFRSVFTKHEAPVHFELPQGVRSLSVEEGVLNCGYALYREVELRDLHFDVGIEWQTCYMSPNEGGSGASTVLYIDFVTVLLGWSAIRDIAKGTAHHHEQGSSSSSSSSSSTTTATTHPLPFPPPSRSLATIEPSLLGPLLSKAGSGDGDDGLPVGVPQGIEGFNAIESWAKRTMEDDSVSRQVLEKHLVEFQRNFLGGQTLPLLEAATTGGGTRSINLAFESVLAKAIVERGPPLARDCSGSGSSGSGGSGGSSGGGGVSGGGHRGAGNGGAGIGRGLKVVTGNPHLAVERAERRFGFEVVRVDDGGGCLSVELLKSEVRDPSVVAVYSQTLSFTDGISDDIPAILAVLEEENKRRLKAKLPLVALINDCCLAFCVLVHNDGISSSSSSSGGKEKANKCLRLLDLISNRNNNGNNNGGEAWVTPCLVTQDAHKHLGTDKGVSTVVGTKGTLSQLTLSPFTTPTQLQSGDGINSQQHQQQQQQAGCVRVGIQPTKGQLVRAVADCLLVGVKGYEAKYKALAIELERVAAVIEKEGMVVVHGKNRYPGSTVIAVEDPSCVMAAKLKKKGYSFAYLFNLYPEEPSRCQTGWSLSLTVHSLRKIGRDGEKTALDTFLGDLVDVHKQVQADKKRFLFMPLNRLGLCFRESSLPAFVLRGGVMDTYLLSFLVSPGYGRSLAEIILRRLFANLFDSGVVCSNKRANPLREFSLGLFLGSLGVSVGGVLLSQRKRLNRPLGGSSLWF